MNHQLAIRTLEDAKEAHRRSCKTFTDKAWKGVNTGLMSNQEFGAFGALLGPRYHLNGTLPASHGGLRHRLFLSLCALTLEATKLRLEEGGHLLHLTFLHHAWCTGDRDTAVDLKAVKQKTKRALSKWKLSYIASIEVEVFRNVVFEDKGRMVCFHVHAFAWGNSFNRETMERELIPQFEAPIPMLGSQKKGVKSVKVQWVTPTEVNVAWVLQYGLKLPWESMSLYRNVDHTKAYVTSSEKSDRVIISTRLTEILSMIELPKLVFAGGEGVAIRRQAVAELRKWVARPHGRHVSRLSSSNDVLAYWAKHKEKQGTQRFSTPLIKV
jgi:hypothetical protein